MLYFRQSFFLAVTIAASSAHAITFTSDSILTAPSVSYDAPPSGNAPGVASLLTITHLAAGGSEAQLAKSLIDSQYPPTSPSLPCALGSAIDVTVDIDAYGVNDPDYSNGNQVQVALDANYSPSTPYDLRWLQIVDTTAPKVPGANPTIDGVAPPGGTLDNLPFYWNEGDPRGGSHFIDTPVRTKPQLNGSLSWTADVFLCGYSPNRGGVGSITIFDGFQWGFALTAEQLKTQPIGPGPDSVSRAMIVPTPEPSCLAARGSSLFLVTRRARRRRAA